MRAALRLRSRWRIPWWNALALALLAVSVGASAVGADRFASSRRHEAQAAFRSESATVASTIKMSLQRMDDLTVAVRTLVGADPRLTNAQLATWWQSMGARDRYPGSLGWGYVQIVPAASLDSFAATVRADPPSGVAESKRAFTVTPAGTRARYCLIRLAAAGPIGRIVPGGGWDLCAVPGSEAFLASIDAGTPTTASASLFAFGEILIVSTPTYRGGGVPPTRAERRARATGWILGAFSVDSVLGAAVEGDRDLAVSISRRTSTGAAAAATPGLGRLTAVARAGHASKSALTRRFTLGTNEQWVITVSRAPRWGWLSPDRQGQIVLAVGALLSLLAFALVQVLARGRAHALQMVAVRTRELRYQALHDPLTGLPNRALILDRAEQLLARCRRGDTQPAALFLDLDDFKAVNDTFGHAIGDTLLQAVARRISGVLRNVDTFGRLGGDEFVVLLESEPGAGVPEAVAERLLETLHKSFRLDALAGEPLTLSASIGIAVGGRNGPDELLRDADTALYAAKGEGKHGFAVFRPEMHATVHGRLALELDLRAALERGELSVDYQPIYRLDDRSAVGVEALLRWHHPERGIVAPAQFIAAAESTGLIVPFGAWVLETACAQAHTWHERGQPLSVAVNISMLQLNDPGFADTVVAALATSRLDPAALTLEITESALMQHPERTAERLHELKALGLRIAVDDFGTGYSSLAYLQQLPVDQLKIDRMFTAGAGESADADALIRTLVRLGRSLRLETVAEGIEDERQLELLRREGCELGQGFLFSEPLAAAGIDRLLRHGTLRPAA